MAQLLFNIKVVLSNQGQKSVFCLTRLLNLHQNEVFLGTCYFYTYMYTVNMSKIVFRL